MNETIKPPAAFDPVPPTGAASILDLPRPFAPLPSLPPRPAPRQTLPVAEAEYPKPPQPPLPSPLPAGIAPEQPSIPLTPAPNPLAGSPAPKASALSGLLWDLLRPNRAKAAVFAGVVSLAVGAFGLNLLVPTGTTASSQPVKLKIPAEIKKPVAEEPQPASSDGKKPIAASEPTKTPGVADTPTYPKPLAGDDTTRRPLAEPRKLPEIKEEPRKAGEQKLPELGDDPFPKLDPNVRPASGPGAAVPPIPKPDPTRAPAPPVDATNPALPGLPPLDVGPGIPAAPPTGLATGPKMPEPPPAPPAGGGLPKLPAIPGENPKPPQMPEPALPALPGGLPMIVPEPVSKPTPPVTPPKPVEMKPVELPKPAPPPAPVEVNPLPLPKPVDLKPTEPLPLPKPVDLKPTEPKLPAVTNPFSDAVPPPLPVAPEVKPAPLPVPPPLGPVVGAGGIAPPPLPVATPTARPPATTPPTPVLEAKTGYDVDLHRTRAGDTYATVSKAYYGGTQYAGALQAFNQNQAINRVAEVQVPPVHVIRKYAEARPAAPGPGANRYTPPRPSGDEINWGEPGSALGGQPEYTQFTVPRKGLTLRDVATTFYGSDRNWSKLNNPLNPKFAADEELPVGTKLQVPTGNITFR